MQKKVLVASVHPPFRELLRLSLEERGGYSVRLVASCEYARYELGKNVYDLVVIDAEEKDASAKNALAGLTRRFPDLPLIVFPPENNPHHPMLQGLAFQAWLKKPFYLPDLLAAAEAVLAGRMWTPEDGIAGPPEWAWLREELSRASSLAALLRAECLAAVFITPGGVVAARTEGLPAAAAEEIAAMVNRLWREGKGRELARAIRRGSSGAQALLYVTRPEKPLLAALILPADTSAARARSLAAQLKENLRLGRQEAARRTGLVEEPAPEASEADAPVPPPEEIEGLDARLYELLQSAPSPDPFRINVRSGGWPVDAEIDMAELEDLGPSWGKPQPAAERPQRPERAQPAVGPADAAPAHAPAVPAGKPPLPSAEEIDLSEKRQVFTCVLIPRLPEYSLVGDLEDLLRGWAAVMCADNGWKTVDLKITNAALQWTLDAPAADSPGALVRIIRQQSSQEILTRLPEFSLPGGESDFWAPGFLIVRGSTPPTLDQIKEFIRQTRLRQGLLPG